ncbi:hypothetical protein KIN20_022262 [Parelaphostrongylus tenuis]|uniref:Uncharacterized protein n=1 Tax=Parelaphostrongylus tenuis TaxID=148309 RepID=A0AAD5MPZ0_PARTN|nr:hypothetical protein KIN20_022262 [Parelaphostrongylus tenuis]
MAFSTVAAALTQILYILQNSLSAEAFVKRLIIQGLVAFMRHTDMMMACVIFGKTVTTTCPLMAAMTAAGAGAGNMCMLSMSMHFTPIPLQHLSISGTLTTYNLIIATWSRDMWQSVVNRVLQMITSGPFGMHFATAVATVI